ncbi:Sodium-dependent neutral amino acid transporter B(0)AT3 [Orchesella cincta]|uniref:Sodium-dependent neutral amino acid transporter B(0)AT3 n=1 Tax=Orchesella cincta TaxID=48709 RepID=A0A1D2NKE7_ORCCI|nr:Sodium-dependent neutral amino acid transporter B(0)AT3 [Orchesella cincta]
MGGGRIGSRNWDGHSRAAVVFMIPYCFMLAFVGIPVFFLELAVGQRRRKGLIYAWNEISPWVGGIGICCGWLCFVVGLYYNTLIAYCISYLIDSFTIPWKDCASATSDAQELAFCESKFSGRTSKYYWFKKTLDISGGIDEAGSYNWKLAIYLLLAWGTIWLILWKGTKSVGAVVYVTAVFPYVVLLIFFLFNFINSPAKGWLGAYRLLYPKWEYLYYPTTWLKAGSQIFFSLGLAYGVLVIFASYNPARNDCHKDAVLISLINCGTSVFAALVVFPIIGVLGYTNYEKCINRMQHVFVDQPLLTTANNYDIYFTTEAIWVSNVTSATPLYIRYGYGELSDDKNDWYYKGLIDQNKRGDSEIIETIKDNTKLHIHGKPLSEALQDCSIGKEATASGGGTGFVFVGFTEAVLHMPVPQLWSILFFLMLIMLGIDSGFGTVEGTVAALEDLTDFSRFKATRTANWTFLGIAFAECVAVGWLYGLAKISYDIRLMTGNKPNLFILICWKYVSPGIIVILLSSSVVQYTVDSINKGITYNPFRDGSDMTEKMPAYTIVIGFLLMIFCMVWIPIHIALRKSKYKLVRDDDEPAEFPEEELRGERNINVEKEADQFSNTEKALMGRAKTSIGDDSTITGDANNRNEKMNLTNNSLDKGAWGSNFSYLLMLVGYAVGFGNIWRFPYQMRENGGRTCVFDPVLDHVIRVRNTSLFLRASSWTTTKKRHDTFLGRNQSNIRWAWNLLWMSFRYPLPWTNCSTATANMADRDECYNDVNGRSSKYYWNRVTLSISQGIDSPGGYNGLLFLYHLITWLAIYLILWKGTKFVGKVVYFTALFPYLVLTSFFIANFAIEPKKAWLGAYRLLKPDWTTLYSPMVWLKAGSQVFYSLGLACGCLVLSDTGSMKNVSHLKYLSDEEKYDIYFTTEAQNWDEVAPDKPIIVRYGYGELLDEDKGNLKNTRDNELFEYIVSINSSMPPSKTLVCGISTIIALLLFPFGWGLYVLDLLDQWPANWTLLLIALAECIAVAWCYGLAKISYDVKLMVGYKPSIIILVCWKYLTPILILFLMVGSIVELQIANSGTFKYKVFDPKNSKNLVDGEYETDFPIGALVIGFVLTIFCVIWLPIQAGLRKTMLSLVKEESPADFPEEQLREERNIHVEKEEQQFSAPEKLMIGSSSLRNLQAYRDNKSQMDVHSMDIHIKDHRIGY